MVPNPALPADEVLIEIISRSFPFKGTLQHLPGGENRSYRAGDIVYRQESRIPEATFIAELYASLPTLSFRLPQPIRSFQGAWVSPERWSVWSFIEGRPAAPGDIPIVIEACEAFHQALAGLPYPSFLATKDTPYTRANAVAWGVLPNDLDELLEPYATQLVSLRKPLPNFSAQLVHGDLNPVNILIAPGLPPAFLDFTPNWYPSTYALAVFAYWIGPARGDPAVLRRFEHIPDFDQLLLRVALSKLIVHYEFKKLGRASANDIVALQTPF
jgi:hypothetical protein